MSLKREPLSPFTANQKKSRAEADDVFGDLSSQKVSAAQPPPFSPLESVYKDGDRSLLFDLKDHVHYSQHYVEPSKYVDYGVALNENAMWNEKFVTRFSTGVSHTRFQAFAKMNSAAMKSFYAGTSIHGEVVTTWSTQYDDETGMLDLHHDKFSYAQQARSIFTQGSSRCGKYIRFRERGQDGRWVELWLPHGSLYTLNKHGSGADVPRDKTGHPVKGAIANAEGVRFVKHAIFGAQRTNASFLEWRPKPGSSFDQVLGDLHGALPASPVVNCYVHPPFPTKSQVGQKKCVEMERHERGKLGAFIKTGSWGVDTAYDVQIEYEEEGLYSEYHPDAPPGMSSDKVYCSFCDTSFLFGKKKHKIQSHCNSKVHKGCKEYGSRAEYDRQNYLKTKEKAVARFRGDGIEMGDEDYTCYCSVCDLNFKCASKEKRERKMNYYETEKMVFKKNFITNHISIRSHQK